LLLVKTWHFNLLIYWVIVAVELGFDYYEVPGARTAGRGTGKRLVQAKLQALQMQLNPHFLFNSLHSILLADAPGRGSRRQDVMRLSDLLRPRWTNPTRRR